MQVYIPEVLTPLENEPAGRKKMQCRAGVKAYRAKKRKHSDS